MTDDQRKLTPTERAHEALMAALLKPPARGSESVTYKDVTIGDLKGRTVIESITIVRGEGETYDEYRARSARTLEDFSQDVTKHNAKKLERELRAVES